MKTTPAPLTWHQAQALRRAWKTRHLAAHIRGEDWHTTLCGRRNPAVTVDPEHRNNPANGTCARCKATADRLKLPTNPTP